MLDQDESKRSYNLIRNTVMSFGKEAQIIIALMGGDGSIMRAIKVLQPLIDLKQIVVAALPFGSGNDMAQCLRWGETTDKHFYRDIKSIVREIVLNCKVTKVNIWEVIMTFNKKGDI